MVVAAVLCYSSCNLSYNSNIFFVVVPIDSLHTPKSPFLDPQTGIFKQDKLDCCIIITLPLVHAQTTDQKGMTFLLAAKTEEEIIPSPTHSLEGEQII